jgi:hypothetical protein
VDVTPEASVVPSGATIARVPLVFTKALEKTADAETYWPAVPAKDCDAACPAYARVRFAGVPTVTLPTTGVESVSANVLLAVLDWEATSEYVPVWVSGPTL